MMGINMVFFFLLATDGSCFNTCSCLCLQKIMCSNLLFYSIHVGKNKLGICFSFLCVRLSCSLLWQWNLWRGFHFLSPGGSEEWWSIVKVLNVAGRKRWEEALSESDDGVVTWDEVTRAETCLINLSLSYTHIKAWYQYTHKLTVTLELKAQQVCSFLLYIT